MNNEQIMDVFGISKRQLRNWQRNGYPAYAVERMSMTDGTHPDWPGFLIGPGHIWTPAGDKVNKGEIEMYHWLFQQAQRESNIAARLESEIRTMNRITVAANEPSTIQSLARLIS